MDRTASGVQHSTGKNRGVTLIEMMAVISVLIIISIIAIPSLAQWRQSSESRQAARNILQLLREARSTAIARNREYRVEFEPPARRYGLRPGDKAIDTDWSMVPPVSDWILCPPEVNFRANIKSIHFNTNGTANGGTVTVSGRDMIKQYEIIVARTGRIRIR